jgi:hypothetical protein
LIIDGQIYQDALFQPIGPDSEVSERSAAAVDHHRLEHLVERPHGDQARDRLVLVQRLAADVGRDPVQQQAAQGGDDTADEQAVSRRADSRPGRPPTRIRRRRRS